MTHSVLASDLSPKEKYFYLIGGIGPRPIAFVSTISRDEIPNLAPFSFFNAFSSNPPVVIFSPARSSNPEKPFKDTYTNLVETKECVVQMVSYEMREQMKLCAQDLDADINEFDISGLTQIPSDIVKAPRVKESPFQMECKLLEMKQLGDQPGAGNLAICEVLKFHVDESVFKPGSQRIDPQAIDLIGRNGEHYYTRASGDAIFEI
ncbi:MAG: flavin reductase family protein [Candidatus Melainabacteria bacterium]|jgi:flavin reductase (DIM6/NTAB) family NADH-FMN oxidoreductase RutF|nr:flavin reductase family protein [Candidatus Melainabacteria bacterium]